MSNKMRNREVKKNLKKWPFLQLLGGRKILAGNEKASARRDLPSYGIIVPRDDPSQTLLTNRWKFQSQQQGPNFDRFTSRISTELFRRRIGKFFICCHLFSSSCHHRLSQPLHRVSDKLPLSFLERCS